MYRAPRGTFDILPQDQPYRRYIEAKVGQICQLYGYERIDTPVFEDAGLFVRSIGEETDIVEKEMYTFEDRGRDKLTLRPEGTASVCRAYLEHGMHNLTQPVKLYYITQIFRYERPQAGRFRQHWQFGFEAIGEADPAVDAQVIDMAWNLYAALGLQNLVLKLNSIGCRQCRPAYIKTLKDYYAGKVENLCPDCKRRAERNTLRLLDCKNESCIPFTEQAPKSVNYLCDECGAHFDSLKKYLHILGHDFNVDHRLVRGLDYYTKTVFEIQPPGQLGAQSTVGGGGRYDNLIEEIGGRPTPAVGFATGIERIILNLKNQDISVPALSQPGVFVAFLGEAAKDKALEYAAKMRQDGMGVILASGSRSLKAQLKQANALNARHALIIGDDELRDGMVMWRDMGKGEQQRLSFDEARKCVRGGL
ncbi:MAG: histidine--tRNA ligase [Dehalococcoidia bacterium]|nr:histidine--tRNA ligase [Dehalococcoidia bacterium]